ncbi:Expansin-A9 [Nymphaea thermarum]|nr:Expansin-A9 [Nymphaea thermarum]
MADRSLAWLVLAMAAVGSSMSTAVDQAPGPWRYAHATFYGDIKGGETTAGACAYEDVFAKGYGLHTTALSTALFQDGATCGACYELMCYNSTWCLPGAGTIKVTATNFCPPNWSIPSDAGGWCNPPRRHFDLSMPMFLRIAQYRGGIVPVAYRRIPCTRHGGIKFEMGGNNFWTSILVYNVAGNGEVSAVGVRTTGSQKFTPLKRNWGQLWNWPDYSGHVGQGMSIRVTTSDGIVVYSDNVVPANWQLGQTFEGNQF